MHPDFEHLNPDGLEDPDKETIKKEKMFKPIDVGCLDDLREQSRKMDLYQKFVLQVAVRFARGIVKSLKPKNKRPVPPLLMVHGGAGSGKSTVISVLAKWVHHILQKPGDDPDCPYIVISAFTGSAASNVNGQTLHSVFSFNFGSEFLTLSDKKREEKRMMFKNLQVLIIDEISLVDSDMMYKIDLRLKEVKQNENPFGGVAVLCFGDLLQIKPVKGRYIFEEPKGLEFKLAFAVNPHWERFRIVNLEENHRQGADKSYADVLNRIRVDKQTDEDMEMLQKRVRPKNHKDMKNPDSLWLFGKNKPVDDMNTIRLLKIKGEELIKIKAKCFHATIKDFKPPLGKTGTIKDTPFQAELRLKIGAKIMLTYNVATADGLTNGSRGTLIGTVRNEENDIMSLVIKFENPVHGQMKRDLNPGLTAKYPGGTSIEKVSFAFSLSKSKRGNIATAQVIQFPIKLAFAATAHKIQGQTVKKPRKVIVDLESVFQPAMAYVMLSRVESIDQLFILETFNEMKIYGSKSAVNELKKMNRNSVNSKPSKWNDKEISATRISTLNCGSIRHQIEHIRNDEVLKVSDVLCFPETWLWQDEDTSKLDIIGFQAHHVAIGRGRGLSIYYKESKFRHIQDVSTEKIQLVKLSAMRYDLIAVYKAPLGNDGLLRDQLEMLIEANRSTIIFGDLNLCFIENRNCRTTKHLIASGFKQIVEEATHISGGHIDQVYMRGDNIVAEVELHSPYYTAKDHDALCILLQEVDQCNE